MSNQVYIATSLDGYIARRDHNLDWLDEIPNPDGLDFGYAAFMAGIDALVMGKNTFNKVLTFGDWAYDKPVFVLSNSLKALPEALKGKVEVVSGPVKDIVRDLNERGYHNLYIDGGQTIAAFLKEDLIDDLTLTRVPRLLGDGIRLFDFAGLDLAFEHQETTVYGNGLVKSFYKRSRK